MEYPPPSVRFEMRDTELVWQRTVLLPQGFERQPAFESIKNAGARLTLQDLARVPLAYVPSRDLTRELVVTGARADRWAVDTAEEVHRYVAGGLCAELSINWTRALGLPLDAASGHDQSSWPFQVRFLEAPLPPWRLYLVWLRGHEPTGALAELRDLVEKFFQAESVLQPPKGT